jgi:TAT (twin-arginine translocation) pathway signal sequence
MSPSRRDFLKSASAAATGAFLAPPLDAIAETSGLLAVPSAGATRAPLAAVAARNARRVEPFALSSVTLRDSVFTQKRDRMLAYAKG